MGDGVKRLLLVVAKEPVPGRVKTRLRGLMSPEMTTEFYLCLLRDTLHLMRQASDVTCGIVFTPAESRAYFEALAPAGFVLHAQRGSGLGERLLHAFEDFLEGGYSRIIIMNSDSPTLPLAYLEEAFGLLDTHDVVFGPSEDGGYYLVGASAPHPTLFLDIQMSTSTVLEETLPRADAAGLSVALLPAWFDVDLPADVMRLRDELSRNGHAAAQTARFFDVHDLRWPSDEGSGP